MRIIAFFQTLRGKLILTYTLVTVLALLALELTILLGGYAFSRGMDTDTLAYLADVVSVLPPQARSYLQPGARDLPGLEEWLQATYEAGYASLPPQGVMDSPAAPIVKSAAMYVISADETILAAAPASAKSQVGQKYSPPADVTGSREIFDRALHMNLQSGQISVVRPDGSYLMAVPVQQSQGEGPLAAVIVVTVKAPPPGLSRLWPEILGIVLVTGSVLLLAVTPFGALFGLIMSRGLTRRIKTLALAADAWSEGDFSVQPQDRSKDEISNLGSRMRRMAENIQALLQTQHELSRMEERNRLARELHDTVKQQIFAALMQLRGAQNYLGADPAAASQALQEAEGLLKSSQQDLGLILAELRPAALDGQGLPAAIHGYLEAWNQHTRILSELHVQGERELPLSVEQALYRILQEALSNVARHNSASLVTIDLAYSAEEVTLTVQDNGCGFDPAAVSGGAFGLQGMQQRAAALGGTFQISHPADGGAGLSVQIPLHSGG